MRERDRLFLILGVMVAVLVVSWMFWVSPERKTAAGLEAQVTSAQQSLATAQTQLQTAQANKSKRISSTIVHIVMVVTTAFALLDLSLLLTSGHH